MPILRSTALTVAPSSEPVASRCSDPSTSPVLRAPPRRRLTKEMAPSPEVPDRSTGSQRDQHRETWTTAYSPATPSPCSSQALEDLTYERRKEFLRQHPLPQKIPIVSFHTEASITRVIKMQIGHLDIHV
ncbi:uncharacterized protein LOC120660468 [Panicum virgatum]|uniref:uncharacterized protein LOC120660468 n=1 Tax=Panicum virgatum TaxID=38727 RepID=UPI0019D51E36|nr:uncharacterized protein LOC120660468 [Panicum virgatum]